MPNLSVNKVSVEKRKRGTLLTVKKTVIFSCQLVPCQPVNYAKAELVGLDCLYLKFRQGVDHSFLYPLSVYAVYDGRGTFIRIIVEVQRNAVLFVLNA